MNNSLDKLIVLFELDTKLSSIYFKFLGCTAENVNLCHSIIEIIKQIFNRFWIDTVENQYQFSHVHILYRIFDI